MPAREDSAPLSVAAQIRSPKISLAEQAWGSVYMTAEYLRRHSAPVFSEGDVTAQQYNVLRILRGAGPYGLPTLTIGNRLVESTPGVTRLLDKLEAKGLVIRTRSANDRRLLVCTLTKAGRDILTRLDPISTERARLAMAPLTSDELRTLNALLKRIREPE